MYTREDEEAFSSVMLKGVDKTPERLCRALLSCNRYYI
jgi:hypothetical protein